MFADGIPRILSRDGFRNDWGGLITKFDLPYPRASVKSAVICLPL